MLIRYVATGGRLKASVFVGTSLDGFIARTDGDLDFLPAGGGEPHGYEEFMATVDALVLGRNTFDIVLAFDTWPYGTKPVFVLSTRPLAPVPAGAVVDNLSGSPDSIVTELEERGIRHIYVDPLFGPLERDIRLRHVATRQHAGGLVQSEYEVAT